MPALDHEEVMTLMLDLVRRGHKMQDCYFIVRPRVRLSFEVKSTINAYELTIKRSESAPIDGFYILPKEDYHKHDTPSLHSTGRLINA
jgi:hypothetical protein